MLPKRNVKPDAPLWVGPAVFNMIRNERLLDAVEQFIGPEIYSNPVQHVRMKPPEQRTPLNQETGRVQVGATPWHQDGGVVNEDADETEMITVWFPLWDALGRIRLPRGDPLQSRGRAAATLSLAHGRRAEPAWGGDRA